MKPEPVIDAKIVAMINDLSVEGLASLLCFYSALETKLRKAILEEYRAGLFPASLIIETWETDNE